MTRQIKPAAGEEGALPAEDAQHDILTGLPGRLLFLDRLLSVIRQCSRYRRNFALLQLRPNAFGKAVADFGAVAGDELLVEAACRLTSCIRESDTVARPDLKSFALIALELGCDTDAQGLAQRLLGRLAEPYYLDEGTVSLSWSVGLAVYPRHGTEAVQLQRSASLALDAARRTRHKNSWRLHAPAQEKSQGDLL